MFFYHLTNKLTPISFLLVILQRNAQTAQLLESMHATDIPSYTTTPQGVLIANDSDHKRCHLLVHQMTRLGSPSLMVTNLDASIFPIIRVPPKEPGEAVHQMRVRRKRNDGMEGSGRLLFDRILCDVPCSGDGTMRKNLGIWKGWNGGDGNGLHG